MLAPSRLCLDGQGDELWVVRGIETGDDLNVFISVLQASTGTKLGMLSQAAIGGFAPDHARGVYHRVWGLALSPDECFVGCTVRARSLSSAQVIKVFSRTERVELTAAVDVPAGLAGFEQAMGYAQKREFEYDAAAAGGGAATPALPTDLCWSGGRLLVCSEHVRHVGIEGSGGGCVEVLDTATGGRLSILQIPGPASLRRALVCSRANSAENRRALLCRRTWVLRCALVLAGRAAWSGPAELEALTSPDFPAVVFERVLRFAYQRTAAVLATLDSEGTLRVHE